jgi:hypothetical protein
MELNVLKICFWCSTNLGENIHRGHLKREFWYRSRIKIESVATTISTNVNMFTITFSPNLRILMWDVCSTLKRRGKIGVNSSKTLNILKWSCDDEVRSLDRLDKFGLWLNSEESNILLCWSSILCPKIPWIFEHRPRFYKLGIHQKLCCSSNTTESKNMGFLRVSHVDACSNHAFPYWSKIVGFTFLGSLYCVLTHQACQSTAVRNSLGIVLNSLMNNLKFLHRLEGSGRLRLPDLKTVGIWKLWGFQPYTPAAFTPQ